MRKTYTRFVLLVLVIISACAPRQTATPEPAYTAMPQPAVETPAPAATEMTPNPEPTVGEAAPASPDATATEVAAAWKPYTNSVFGFSFQYPASWYGPDEYVSDQSLRVAVGSDKVYPYGTSLEEQIPTIKNSYLVVIQYIQNNQNQFWQEAYQPVAALQDGETLSNQRGMTIRVRAVQLGRFQGVEYITTLSDTAQTEPVYIRQVILFDDQSNVLSIMGSPNNVEISPAAGWREAYQAIDEANLALFRQIVDTIIVK
jgi:hypothetical protein